MPTRLLYDTTGPGPTLLAWGLEVPSVAASGQRIEEFFKINFEKEDVDPSHTEHLYTDYLGSLYWELSKRFDEGMIGRPWKSAQVHFCFSIPANWTPEAAARFKGLASAAGFGQGGCPGHTLSLSVTEPEAVAAFQLCDDSANSEISLQVLAFFAYN